MSDQLREPEQMDWENHHAGSNFQRPPAAKDESGQWITYRYKLPKDLGSPERLKVTGEGYRAFNFGGALQLPANRTYEIPFWTQSVKKYTNRKTGEQMEVSGVSKILRAAGFPGKPQTNKEYELAVRGIGGREIMITIDWRAYNKENGETVDGYDLFPLDPERPGQRQAILRKGDKLTDGTEVTSEVLFANAQPRFVQDKQRAS